VSRTGSTTQYANYFTDVYFSSGRVIKVKARTLRITLMFYGIIHSGAYSTIAGAKAQLAYNFIVVAFQ